MPKLSVVMSVYNGERFIAEAIDSILTQTFTDFEMIIVDDASEDDSAAIIRSCAEGDSRIRFMQQRENQGNAAAMNRGIEAARGEYIAIMDCDDVSLPQRLMKQIDLLEGRPEIAMVGTQAKAVDVDLKPLYDRRPPTEHAQIVWEKCMGMPFVHASLMMRRQSLRASGGYGKGMRYSADADMTTRFLGAGLGRFANIAERLLLYRIHAGQQTAQMDEIRRGNIQTMYSRLFQRLFDEEWEGIMRRLLQVKNEERLSWRARRAVKDDLEKLIDAMVAKSWVEASERTALNDEMNRWLESGLPRRVQQLLHWRRHRFGR